MFIRAEKFGESSEYPLKTLPQSIMNLRQSAKYTIELTLKLEVRLKA